MGEEGSFSRGEALGEDVRLVEEALDLCARD